MLERISIFHYFFIMVDCFVDICNAGGQFSSIDGKNLGELFLKNLQQLSRQEPFLSRITFRKNACVDFCHNSCCAIFSSKGKISHKFSNLRPRQSEKFILERLAVYISER